LILEAFEGKKRIKRKKIVDYVNRVLIKETSPQLIGHYLNKLCDEKIIKRKENGYYEMKSNKTEWME